MKRTLLLLAVLPLVACSQPEESVANRFDRTNAEIENKARELDAEVENQVRDVEAEMQNQIDAMANQQVNTTAPAEANATLANSAR